MNADIYHYYITKFINSPPAYILAIIEDGNSFSSRKVSNGPVDKAVFACHYNQGRTNLNCEQHIVVTR